MPFKDKEKERAWRKAYWAARPKQRKAIMDRWRAKNREKLLAYQKEYTKRPEVIEKRAKDYLEHREERLLNAKKNRLMKGYNNPPYPVGKKRKSSRDCARRKRLGIEIERTPSGYFWKAGILSNGPFDYRKDAVKDAERAFLL